MNLRILSALLFFSVTSCKPASAPSTVQIGKPATNSNVQAVQPTATPIPTQIPAPTNEPYAVVTPAPYPVVTLPPAPTINPACQQASQIQGATGILGAAAGFFSGNWVNGISGVITAINRPTCT